MRGYRCFTSASGKRGAGSGDESHDLFLAEVVACDVDESLLDENGKLCLDKAKLIVYSHGEYLTLGKKLGTFGYSVRKKKPTRKPHR